MNICVFNKSSNGKLYVNWIDKLFINDMAHLYGSCNGKRVFESTHVIALSLQRQGIVINTRSGSKYIITTPGKKAMKRLFKQLVAQS